MTLSTVATLVLIGIVAVVSIGNVGEFAPILAVAVLLDHRNPEMTSVLLLLFVVVAVAAAVVAAQGLDGAPGGGARAGRRRAGGPVRDRLGSYWLGVAAVTSKAGVGACRTGRRHWTSSSAGRRSSRVSRRSSPGWRRGSRGWWASRVIRGWGKHPWPAAAWPAPTA